MGDTVDGFAILSLRFRIGFSVESKPKADVVGGGGVDGIGGEGGRVRRGDIGDDHASERIVLLVCVDFTGRVDPANIGQLTDLESWAVSHCIVLKAREGMGTNRRTCTICTHDYPSAQHMAIVEGNVGKCAGVHARPHVHDLEWSEDRNATVLGSLVEDLFCGMLWNTQHVIVLRVFREGLEIFRFDFIIARPDDRPLQLDALLDKGICEAKSLKCLEIEAQLVCGGLQDHLGRYHDIPQ